MSRSELIREALREYLKSKRLQALEERDRKGYQRKPVKQDEFDVWDVEAVWPDD